MRFLKIFVILAIMLAIILGLLIVWDVLVLDLAKDIAVKLGYTLLFLFFGSVIITALSHQK